MPARHRPMYNAHAQEQPTSDSSTNRPFPARSTIRLQHFDYSTPGAYFVTICTYRKACLLGDVIDDRIHTNSLGAMVESTWREMSHAYPGIRTDSFVVMPNHVHGILFLMGGPPTVPTSGGQAWEPAPTMRLPDVVHRFKSLTTTRYSVSSGREGVRPILRHLWQRNYYEHVIRSEESLHRIREYIENNPAAWAMDRENPTPPEAPVSSASAEPWQV